MEELEVFIGEWELEAAFQFPVPNGVEARSTFARDLDNRYLVQRSEISLPEAPDVLIVVAPAAENYIQFSELKFHQRFFGEFSDDGNTIDGRWELDFGLVYRRT